MPAFVKQYILTLAIFMAIDLVWLGFVARDLYRKHLGHLMSAQINWAAAIIFYLLYITGLVFFVIRPALDKGSLSHALLAGAFFGLVTYATYDLTNLATIRDWPLTITIIDLAWGTALGAMVSGASYWFYLRIF